ncbi:MAG TPA: radical SAM protein [Firmicutes bacterium]|nr:radical SAM protein [Bacillota bacterium]
MKYIFGPVPSRRLGISLGIDLVPFKTCSFDCIYCECGKTTKKTIIRREYVPYKNVIDEIKTFLNGKPALDYITFSGSGEPTLSSSIGKLIKFLKKHYPQYKIAVLTNGSLLYRKSVRNDLIPADLIIPSFDSASHSIFQKINRPHSRITIERMISGLKKLRQEFKGEIWIEVFIAKSVNDSSVEINKIKKVLEKIKPDRIQFNTLDRPGTIPSLKPVPEKDLKKITERIPGSEIIAKFPDKSKFYSEKSENIEEAILRILARRPVTLQDLNVILNLKIAEINKYIRILKSQNKITEKKGKRGIFFILK